MNPQHKQSESRGENLLLSMEKINKIFPGNVVATNNVSLEVRQGEIHCLLGENGAGKTVLMNILYGMYQPDSGQIYYKGQPISIHSPKDSIENRIGMVHQHFMLVETLTVAENIILGQWKPWKNLKEMEKVHERIKNLGEEYGLFVNPNALIRELSVGEQQRVEILKALYRGTDLLILDEPTSVLTPQETVQLLNLLRGLADKGLTIIFITHKFEEVFQVSDRVTVLRDGQLVGTTDTAQTTFGELAKWMVGREVFMDLDRSKSNSKEVVLSVRGLQATDERGLLAVKDVSFDVHANEIVGIAGVSGNGQTELALGLAGLIEIKYDRLELCGQELKKITAKNLDRIGFGHIPEDRQGMGLILPFSVAENFILGEYNSEPYSHYGFLQNRQIINHAQLLVNKFSVRVSNVKEEITNLSGGNQQKVVVARELNRNPNFLLVNQPTRGIDIGATEFVYQQILKQRDAGSAVLLISTDLEEVFKLSDRVLVMFEGQIIGEVPPDREQIFKVGLMMAGKQVEEELA
ncbi:MAG: ABC transporter ATP-binding protein [Anaerolineaceae bacterium]|nr:ABC transporter ATP-binding protein [Anaerolineaceae bacterium]